MTPIGVVVQTSFASAAVQATAVYRNFGSQTSAQPLVDAACQTVVEPKAPQRNLISLGVQTDAPEPSTSVPFRSEFLGKLRNDVTGDEGSVPASSSSATLTHGNSGRRSLSPMEIDSTLTTPCLSPLLAPSKDATKVIIIDLIPKLEDLTEENGLNGMMSAVEPPRSQSQTRSRSSSLSVMSFSSDEYEPPPATPFEAPLVFNPSHKKTTQVPARKCQSTLILRIPS